LKVGFSEKCENARNRRIAVFSATRSPIDARFVASDGKSKPALDRRNGFFDFDPRNLWGAKWGVLHFWTKCATEFFRSQTSCGKVVDLVDPKPTQKTGPKNSHGRPRYRDFSKFSGIRNSPIGNGTVSVARRAKFGRAQRALALPSHSCGSAPSQSGSRRVVRHNPDLRRTPGSRVTDRRKRRVGEDLVGFGVRRAARLERVWKANSFLSRSGGALAVASKVFRCGTSRREQLRMAARYRGRRNIE
jgi:hypothetical protein